MAHPPRWTTTGVRRPRGVGRVQIVVVILGAACNTERGSGTVVTRRIDVPSFSRLEVSDSFTVDVSGATSRR